MEDKQILLNNIDEIHTTEMGVIRIKKNLKLDTEDVVEYCKDKVLDKNCNIYKQGKNWYCEIDNLNCQIKLDFSSNSEKLGMVFDNSKTS